MNEILQLFPVSAMIAPMMVFCELSIIAIKFLCDLRKYNCTCRNISDSDSLIERKKERMNEVWIALTVYTPELFC